MRLLFFWWSRRIGWPDNLYRLRLVLDLIGTNNRCRLWHYTRSWEFRGLRLSRREQFVSTNSKPNSTIYAHLWESFGHFIFQQTTNKSDLEPHISRDYVKIPCFTYVPAVRSVFTIISEPNISSRKYREIFAFPFLLHVLKTLQKRAITYRRTVRKVRLRKVPVCLL